MYRSITSSNAFKISQRMYLRLQTRKKRSFGAGRPHYFDVKLKKRLKEKRCLPHLR